MLYVLSLTMNSIPQTALRDQADFRWTPLPSLSPTTRIASAPASRPAAARSAIFASSVSVAVSRLSRFAARVPETGVTVHEVDEGVDTGPILAQESVSILPGDTPETLLERLHAVEHRLLPQVARQLVAERLRSRQ